MPHVLQAATSMSTQLYSYKYEMLKTGSTPAHENGSHHPAHRYSQLGKLCCPCKHSKPGAAQQPGTRRHPAVSVAAACIAAGKALVRARTHLLHCGASCKGHLASDAITQRWLLPLCCEAGRHSSRSFCLARLLVAQLCPHGPAGPAHATSFSKSENAFT